MIRTDYNKDDSGGYQPNGLIESSPFFAWPPRPSKAVKHLFNCPGYLLPWYPMYVTIALITWFVLTPDLADMQSFELRWITTIYFRNIGLLILIWGTWHFRSTYKGRKEPDTNMISPGPENTVDFYLVTKPRTTYFGAL